MGFEYKIAFLVPDPVEAQAVPDRLRSVFLDAMGTDFTVSLESDGFYFCDHTRSDRSSCAFRRLVDEALSHSKVIVHEL